MAGRARRVLRRRIGAHDHARHPECRSDLHAQEIPERFAVAGLRLFDQCIEIAHLTEYGDRRSRFRSIRRALMRPMARSASVWWVRRS
jgi:hypothetical protein